MSINDVLVILILIFGIDYKFCINFIEDHRQKFYRLVKAFPYGQLPKDSNLKTVYTIVQQTKCCPIDDYKKMDDRQKNVFHLFGFIENCYDQWIESSKSRFVQTCMNYVYYIYEKLLIINIIKMIAFAIVWISLGLYIISRKDENNLSIQSLERVVNDREMIHIQNTLINNPNLSGLPTYQEALQESRT